MRETENYSLNVALMVYAHAVVKNQFQVRSHAQNDCKRNTMKDSNNVPIELNGSVYVITPNGDVSTDGPIPHYDSLDIVRCLAADIFTTEKRRELTEAEFDYWQNVRRPHGRDFYGKDY